MIKKNDQGDLFCFFDVDGSLMSGTYGVNCAQGHVEHQVICLWLPFTRALFDWFLLQADSSSV